MFEFFDPAHYLFTVLLAIWFCSWDHVSDHPEIIVYVAVWTVRFLGLWETATRALEKLFAMISPAHANQSRFPSVRYSLGVVITLGVTAVKCYHGDPLDAQTVMLRLMGSIGFLNVVCYLARSTRRIVSSFLREVVFPPQ
jgi:hypothetical protein